jgi:hypothetical protein
MILLCAFAVKKTSMFKKTKASDATADALSIVVLHESF